MAIKLKEKFGKNCLTGILTTYCTFDDEDLNLAAHIFKQYDMKAYKQLQKRKFKSARKLADTRDFNIFKSLRKKGKITPPAPTGLSYYPYQIAGIEYGLNKSGILISDEMGLGKTIQALGIINVKKPKTVLVLCPASLKINWGREAERWLTTNHNIIILDRHALPSNIKKGSNLVIGNYASLPKWQATLERVNWDLSIFDECHYLKNFETAIRSQISFELASMSKEVIFITGTPIVNKPEDLWGFLHTLNPSYWDNSIQYLNEFCDREKLSVEEEQQLLGKLQRKLRGTVMIRRMKEDVLTDLPPKTRQLICIPACKEIKERIELENALFKQMQETAFELHHLKNIDLEESKYKNAEFYEKMSSLKSKIKISFDELSTLRIKSTKEKLPYAIEFISNLLKQTNKVIVFAHHTDIIKTVQGAFPKISVRLIGEDSEQKRQISIDRFQYDDKIKLFIGGIKSAGVGITLTASSTVVFLEMDWVPANLIQAEDRCHRIGQKDNVLIYYLALENSIDERIAEVLIKKQDIIETTLNP